MKQICILYALSPHTDSKQATVQINRYDRHFLAARFVIKNHFPRTNMLFGSYPYRRC